MININMTRAEAVKELKDILLKLYVKECATRQDDTFLSIINEAMEKIKEVRDV